MATAIVEPPKYVPLDPNQAWSQTGTSPAGAPSDPSQAGPMQFPPSSGPQAQVVPMNIGQSPNPQVIYQPGMITTGNNNAPPGVILYQAPQYIQEQVQGEVTPHPAWAIGMLRETKFVCQEN